MKLLAIDPGPTESAYVVYENGKPTHFAKVENELLLGACRNPTAYDLPVFEEIVVEKVESFGMAVGAEVFETVFWSGRFAEAAGAMIGYSGVHRIGRKAVKLHLCRSVRAKDANIRQALIDKYGGKAVAIGTKKSRGPLYGVAGDVWSALAVAVTWAETVKKEKA